MIAVAAAFGAHQLIFHSQQIIVERDPASYMQFAAWIAHHGSLPIPQARAAFGGTHQALIFNSPAFYQVGGTMVPQFMAGLPMVLAAGFWIGGVAAAVLVPPLLGACVVLTFGGLAARLTGPRWAPLAALVLALSLPEQFTSRSAFSEPLVQILFLGGLCLVIDSLQGGAGARVIAALGGLALGLTLLVRIDGASDILPVIPYCGILLLSWRRQAVPLLAWWLACVLCGAIDGLVLYRPYLVHIKGLPVPLALVAAAMVIAQHLGGDGAVVLRPAPGTREWLPNAAAMVPVVVVILFTARAYLHRVSNQPIQATASSQQMANWILEHGMISLRWVFWYIGIPAVVLGTFAAAVLARRCLQGRAPGRDAAADGVRLDHRHRPLPAGDLPRPAVAEAPPVPVVLPGLILLAVWLSNWLVSWVRKYVATGRLRLCLVLRAALLLVGATTGGDHLRAEDQVRRPARAVRSRTAWRSRERTPVRSSGWSACARRSPAVHRSSSSASGPATRCPRSSAGCAVIRWRSLGTPRSAA